MIVPMKKVTILCLASARDDALERLRDLGVVHLHPIRPPEGDEIEAARQVAAPGRRALETLPRHAARGPSGRPPAEIVEAIWARIHERKELEERLDERRRERQRIEPFGAFEPAAARALLARGLCLRLYRCDPRTEPRAPEGAVLRVLRRAKDATYFVVLGPTDATVVGEATEIRMPEVGLVEVDRQIAEIEAALEANARALAEYAGDRAAVAEYVAAAEDRLRFLEARAGMGAAERVVWLRGFCPVDAMDGLRAAAAEAGWAVLAEDPAENDPVPTLIRHPWWVRPIRPVFDLIGILPGYREVDIGAVFLLFFSLFFAMLVGDAGYGLLFLGLTLWARRRIAPRRHPGIPLMMILSVATIVWGALTGSWFGAPRLPAPLAALRCEWLAPADPKLGQQRIMGLSFLIGAIQLSIAHAWNIYRQRRSLQALAQLGWLGMTWTMYFVAGAMVLGHTFPRVMGAVFVTSVALIVLFMTPPARLKTEWFNHVMLPLNLVTNFVDVVSYIRLFAVGTAGFAMAQAFNNIVLGLGRAGWIQGLLAAVILFMGHALNIALSAMGVIVHGVRLNTLEFATHLGMEWSGIPYRPFAHVRPAGGTLAESGR